jgi:hypothetical protein
VIAEIESKKLMENKTPIISPLNMADLKILGCIIFYFNEFTKVQKILLSFKFRVAYLL